MALKITNREVEGVAVLALDGRIVLGEETSTLREKVKNLLAEGKKNIVLNLSNVTQIDSSGLGATCHRRIQWREIAGGTRCGCAILGRDSAEMFCRLTKPLHRLRSLRQ